MRRNGPPARKFPRDVTREECSLYDVIARSCLPYDVTREKPKALLQSQERCPCLSSEIAASTLRGVSSQ